MNAGKGLVREFRLYLLTERTRQEVEGWVRSKYPPEKFLQRGLSKHNHNARRGPFGTVFAETMNGQTAAMIKVGMNDAVNKLLSDVRLGGGRLTQRQEDGVRYYRWIPDPEPTAKGKKKNSRSSA